MNSPIPSGYQARSDELRGRVIAITGAGEGIGQAVALAAAAHGAEVILIGRTLRKLERVHAQIAQLKQREASIAPLDLEKARSPATTTSSPMRCCALRATWMACCTTPACWAVLRRSSNTM